MAKQAMTLTCLTAVLALLISLASAQVTQCAPDGSPQLRFVAQLSVSGCALTVHDTGANHTKHLVVEPLMCVTGDLHSVLPRYDPITQQTYVSVPVMLRDDAMLAEVERQLRHLSPKSVKFATVTDISVSTDASSVIQALGFVWSLEESVGFLRLGCDLRHPGCPALRIWGLVLGIRSSQTVDLDHVTVSLAVTSNCTTSRLSYRLMMQNHSFIDPDFFVSRFTGIFNCKQLRFIRSIRLTNCTARVHQRLDMKGHFLIEPLLCHNITSMSYESVLYDYSTDTHCLKLDLVLQDDVTVDAVRTQLADLEPRSVAFMRLWRAQSVVASALSGRFRIGPLMVSADWRSAQVRVHCSTEDQCLQLRSGIVTSPVDFWRHMKWSLTSLVSDGQCLFKSQTVSYARRMQESWRVQSILAFGTAVRNNCVIGRMCKIFKTSQGRLFTVIQQRVTGRVSFKRSWTEYERGFGDGSDFWIGLSTIHSLSINGATLRVEMKLWNGTELHVEYAGFKVGDAATNYLMTYREMLRDKSSVSFDAMEHHKGMQFSTIDRDNDRWSGSSCSNEYGKGGWWFQGCKNCNPNGLFPTGETMDGSYMHWPAGSKLSLREVRLMLQI